MTRNRLELVFCLYVLGYYRNMIVAIERKCIYVKGRFLLHRARDVHKTHVLIDSGPRDKKIQHISNSMLTTFRRRRVKCNFGILKESCVVIQVKQYTVYNP